MKAAKRLEQLKKADMAFRDEVEEVYIFVNSFTFMMVFQSPNVFRELECEQQGVRPLQSGPDQLPVPAQHL